MRVCVCVYGCVSVCVRMCVCVCVCTCISDNLSVCVSLFVDVHVYPCPCREVCVFVVIWVMHAPACPVLWSDDILMR